jgi:hypothetical protein
MMSTIVAVIVLFSTFGGALLGMAIRARLPDCQNRTWIKIPRK